ncbi:MULTISPECIES: rod-binding protein [Geobacter]|uniref:Flagellar rod assembly protein FlgJ n=2 Tax=Geobacter TaxID=28231 RepID=A0A0C1TVG3_9BACT|nr:MULTISPECIES: rod-binding protein [Geobacter]ANA41237.1 flagellar biosynthesis protein FlgJ [Geobacter anodireducens]KIE43378.1 flagellar rod assembly protein FlgJ [Geobacter soli]MBE2887772.1 rod-binding protein [Geobacter anodireducens]HMN01768.1 rod-binding protein [Geobacter anodireducens]
MHTRMPTETLMADAETARARQLASRAGKVEQERMAAKKVAREFEAVFIGMMLKSMRDTVGKDDLTGGGRGEEIFRSMLDQEYATACAASGGLGLAPLIEQQILPRETQPSVVPAAKPAADEKNGAR